MGAKTIVKGLRNVSLINLTNNSFSVQWEDNNTVLNANKT